MEQIIEVFNYSFMSRAFIAGFFISLIAPIIGSFLVVKRMSIISDVFSHVALAGVALGLFLGINPVITVIFSTILIGLIIENIRKSNTVSIDSVLAMIMPAGLSIALILITLAKGFNTSLNNYLFGSITAVSDYDIYLISFLSIIIFISFLFFYREFFYVAFDEETAKLSNINIEKINYFFVILVSMTVSLSIKIVGALLVGALISIPVLSANQITVGFKKSIFVSMIIALFSVFLGIFLSYFLNIPAGATIVMILIFIFFINFFVLKKLVIL